MVDRGDFYRRTLGLLQHLRYVPSSGHPGRRLLIGPTEQEVRQFGPRFIDSAAEGDFVLLPATRSTSIAHLADRINSLFHKDQSLITSEQQWPGFYPPDSQIIIAFHPDDSPLHTNLPDWLSTFKDASTSLLLAVQIADWSHPDVFIAHNQSQGFAASRVIAAPLASLLNESAARLALHVLALGKETIREVESLIASIDSLFPSERGSVRDPFSFSLDSSRRRPDVSPHHSPTALWPQSIVCIKTTLSDVLGPESLAIGMFPGSNDRLCHVCSSTVLTGDSERAVAARLDQLWSTAGSSTEDDVFVRWPFTPSCIISEATGLLARSSIAELRLRQLNLPVVRLGQLATVAPWPGSPDRSVDYDLTVDAPWIITENRGGDPRSNRTLKNFSVGVRGGCRRVAVAVAA